MQVGVFGYSSGSAVYLDYLEKFSNGMRVHGTDVFMEYENIYRECDVAVIFGSCRRDKLKNPDNPHSHKAKVIDTHKGRVVYVESCLLGRIAKVARNKHWRVGVDSFMFDGDFGFRDNPPSDRWDDLGIELKPWKTGGDYILVCQQLLKDASLMGANHYQWTNDTVNYLLANTDQNIVVRLHPLVKGKDYHRMMDFDLFNNPRVNKSEGTLPEDLENASCAISYTSGSGIDAIIAGVPHIACHKASMVSPISGHSLDQINNIPTPDRMTHLKNLAYAQWTVDEMESGECWEHLLTNVFNAGN